MSMIVLYVEDEPNDVLFMSIAFKKIGMGGVLRSVEDGRHAIAYLAAEGVYADRQNHPLPTLMLLDLNLPVVSGFEVLEWLNGKPELKKLPVVIFSSSARAEDEAHARELGATDYVEKPQSGQGFVKVAQFLKERWLTQPVIG